MKKLLVSDPLFENPYQNLCFYSDCFVGFSHTGSGPLVIKTLDLIIFLWTTKAQDLVLNKAIRVKLPP